MAEDNDRFRPGELAKIWNQRRTERSPPDSGLEGEWGPPDLPFDPDFSVTRLAGFGEYICFEVRRPHKPTTEPGSERTFPLELQSEIIKHLELNPYGTNVWHGHIPSDAALVSRHWAIEIQPLYYTYCRVDIAEAVSATSPMRREDYCVSFFNAILHPFLGNPARHVRRLTLRDDSYTETWWDLFVEAIPLMERLERLDIQYDYKHRVFGRMTDVSHRFSPTLKVITLEMDTIERPFTEVSETRANCFQANYPTDNSRA